MTDRQLGQHHIRDWREYRRLSLERCVARMEKAPGDEPVISAMSLSRIERGVQPYSEEVLNALAHALDCDVWELISVNPKVDGKVIDLLRFVRDLKPEEGLQALRILKAAITR